MQPWKKVALTDEQLQVLYREWGVFYTLKQKFDIAAKYYDKSLDLGVDAKALYNRSRCKRNLAQTQKALHDAESAMASDPRSQPFNIEVCDGLYQLNQFENTKASLFNKSLKFKGLALRAFNYRHNVLELDFKATLGDALGYHILSNEKYFHLAREKFDREVNADRRPLWKILRERSKCDVLSVLEKEEELVSPREMARRQRAFHIFNQIYMLRSWVDVLFLRALMRDRNLLLPQSRWSRPLLEQITSSKYVVAMRFLKMLHARSPLYNERHHRCPNQKLARKQTEDYLYRVQYQNHRNMLTILKKIHYLRRIRHLNKLCSYVEQVMGNYVVLKITRVMPWKFEFINEVYNLLALAYIDLYVDIPKNLFEVRSSGRLQLLLKMPSEKDREPQPFVFGDKSTYQDEDIADIPLNKHKKYMSRMKKRLMFAKYPIEKSYAWHAIAGVHLRLSRFDECCNSARKCIEEARECGSLVWMFLGYLMSCKSHSVLRKIEKIQEVLEEASVVVAELDDPKISGFMRLLRQANDQDTFEKRADEMRKLKAWQSVSSRISEFQSASSGGEK